MKAGQGDKERIKPRGMEWGGRREGGSGWTHVNPWLIHVNVWQKPLQYCKVISIQLININEKKKKKILKKKKSLMTLICVSVSCCAWSWTCQNTFQQYEYPTTSNWCFSTLKQVLRDLKAATLQCQEAPSFKCSWTTLCIWQNQFRGGGFFNSLSSAQSKKYGL